MQYEIWPKTTHTKKTSKFLLRLLVQLVDYSDEISNNLLADFDTFCAFFEY